MVVVLRDVGKDSATGSTLGRVAETDGNAEGEVGVLVFGRIDIELRCQVEESAQVFGVVDQSATVDGSAQDSTSNEVTMPNLFPPPFNAQNKSGFSVADVCTMDPLARTT